MGASVSRCCGGYDIKSDYGGQSADDFAKNAPAGQHPTPTAVAAGRAETQSFALRSAVINEECLHACTLVSLDQLSAWEDCCACHDDPGQAAAHLGAIQVSYQNSASIMYYGDLMQSHASGSGAASSGAVLLLHLFMLVGMEAMRDMLGTVLANGVWSRLVQVPAYSSYANEGPLLQAPEAQGVAEQQQQEQQQQLLPLPVPQQPVAAVSTIPSSHTLGREGNTGQGSQGGASEAASQGQAQQLQPQQAQHDDTQQQDQQQQQANGPIQQSQAAAPAAHAVASRALSETAAAYYTESRFRRESHPMQEGSQHSSSDPPAQALASAAASDSRPTAAAAAAAVRARSKPPVARSRSWLSSMQPPPRRVHTTSQLLHVLEDAKDEDEQGQSQQRQQLGQEQRGQGPSERGGDALGAQQQPQQPEPFLMAHPLASLIQQHLELPRSGSSDSGHGGAAGSKTKRPPRRGQSLTSAMFRALSAQAGPNSGSGSDGTSPTCTFMDMPLKHQPSSFMDTTADNPDSHMNLFMGSASGGWGSSAGAQPRRLISMLQRVGSTQSAAAGASSGGLNMSSGSRSMGHGVVRSPASFSGSSDSGRPGARMPLRGNAPLPLHSVPSEGSLLDAMSARNSRVTSGSGGGAPAVHLLGAAGAAQLRMGGGSNAGRRKKCMSMSMLSYATNNSANASANANVSAAAGITIGAASGTPRPFRPRPGSCLSLIANPPLSALVPSSTLAAAAVADSLAPGSGDSVGAPAAAGPWSIAESALASAAAPDAACRASLARAGSRGQAACAAADEAAAAAAAAGAAADEAGAMAAAAAEFGGSEAGSERAPGAPREDAGFGSMLLASMLSVACDGGEGRRSCHQASDRLLRLATFSQQGGDSRGQGQGVVGGASGDVVGAGDGHGQVDMLRPSVADGSDHVHPQAHGADGADADAEADGFAAADGEEVEGGYEVEEGGYEVEGEPGPVAAPRPCWHEVTAKVVKDPVTGSPCLLLVQRDVTSRAELEGLLSSLTENQLVMLSQIFPRHVIEFLSVQANSMALQASGLAGLARQHKEVTLLFMDVVSFTSMAKAVSPQQVMSFLNALFSIFDALCDVHGVHKVETAGDAYIVSSGVLEMDEEGFYTVLPSHDPADSAARVMAFAKDMLRHSRSVCLPHTGEPVQIRIGLHSGDVYSGVVGSKLPKFSLFGDAMNTSARMESTSKPGRIHVSEAAQQLLPHEQWEPTQGVMVKGKGMMETYLWVPPPEFQLELLQQHPAAGCADPAASAAAAGAAGAPTAAAGIDAGAGPSDAAAPGAPSLLLQGSPRTLPPLVPSSGMQPQQPRRYGAERMPTVHELCLAGESNTSGIEVEMEVEPRGAGAFQASEEDELYALVLSGSNLHDQAFAQQQQHDSRSQGQHHESRSQGQLSSLPSFGTSRSSARLARSMDMLLDSGSRPTWAVDSWQADRSPGPEGGSATAGPASPLAALGLEGGRSPSGNLRRRLSASIAPERFSPSITHRAALPAAAMLAAAATAAAAERASPAVGRALAAASAAASAAAAADQQHSQQPSRRGAQRYMSFGASQPAAVLMRGSAVAAAAGAASAASAAAGAAGHRRGVRRSPTVSAIATDRQLLLPAPPLAPASGSAGAAAAAGGAGAGASQQQQLPRRSIHRAASLNQTAATAAAAGADASGAALQAQIRSQMLLPLANLIPTSPASAGYLTDAAAGDADDAAAGDGAAGGVHRRPVRRSTTTTAFAVGGVFAPLAEACASLVTRGSGNERLRAGGNPAAAAAARAAARAAAPGSSQQLLESSPAQGGAAPDAGALALAAAQSAAGPTEQQQQQAATQAD